MRRGLRLTVPGQVLAVLCLMYLVLYVDRVNIATVGPRMSADLGLSNTQFGLAVSAFSYPYAFIQLFGGWVSDRFGARRMLVLCGAIVCTATLLTGMAGGLASLVALRILLGLGKGFCFPTVTRAMAMWLPASRWGHAQGITHAAARLGNALTTVAICLSVALFFAELVVAPIWAVPDRGSPAAVGHGGAQRTRVVGQGDDGGKSADG